MKGLLIFLVFALAVGCNGINSGQKDLVEVELDSSDFIVEVKKYEPKYKRDSLTKEEASIPIRISDLCYVKNIFIYQDQYYMEIDYVNWYSGKKATKIVKERGIEDYGFIIHNPDTTIHTIKVDTNVMIEVLNVGIGYKKETIKLDSLYRMIGSSYLEYTPFRIRTRDSVITKLLQMYTP